MNCVNNCLTMSNALDTQEIALERLRNVLTIFEKKKRNLDKRKNKLDEYKKKKDLNEDQQMAVSKYQEVVSNLELVDELNTLALQQIRDAEKTLKKTKKMEKLENKRHETSLIEFVMRTSYLLERIFESDKVQSKLLSDNCLESAELQLLKELHQEIHINEKGNWKKCSEHFQSLYEGGNKATDLNMTDHVSTKSVVTKDDLLKCIDKIANIDWISTGASEEPHFDRKFEHEAADIGGDSEEIEESNVCEEIAEAVEEDDEEEEEGSLPIANKEVETTTPIEKSSAPPTAAENPKLSFVFLHESIVQEDSGPKSNENGYEITGFNNNDDHGARSNSQMSDVDNSVDDVFSSATQSEFMHSENSRNLKIRGQRQPTNGRFRIRGTPQAATTFANRDAPTETVNYWKSNNRGAFNSNSRYPRSSRSRGRGRGNGRSDNRPSNEEILTPMQ